MTCLIESIPLPGEEEFYADILILFLKKLVRFMKKNPSGIPANSSNALPERGNSLSSTYNPEAGSHFDYVEDHPFLDNVNEKSSILHKAAMIGNDIAAEILIQYHSKLPFDEKNLQLKLAKKYLSVDYLDKNGETALLKSILKSNSDTAALLLHYGANPFINSNTCIQPYRYILQHHSSDKTLINLVTGISLFLLFPFPFTFILFPNNLSSRPVPLFPLSSFFLSPCSQLSPSPFVLFLFLYISEALYYLPFVPAISFPLYHFFFSSSCKLRINNNEWK